MLVRVTGPWHWKSGLYQTELRHLEQVLSGTSSDGPWVPYFAGESNRY